MSQISASKAISLPKKLNRLLPLVAIGTVADCQSILEPCNRLLVKTGLQILSRGSHKIDGLNALMEQTGLQAKTKQGYQLNSQDLAFVFSPILNSSGRMSHARLSIATLLEGGIEGQNLAAKLVATNEERKNMVKNILKEVNQQAKEQMEMGQQTLWLEGDWSKGIVGLIASRLVSEHNLPVVVISLPKKKKKIDWMEIFSLEKLENLANSKN